jgi:hypothetical protein
MSIRKQISQINILYLALLSGQLMIFLLLFLFMGDNAAEQIAEEVSGSNSLTLIIPFFCVATIGGAFLLYNKRKEEARQLSGSIEDKLVHYRVSFLIRAAMIEGANLVALLFYFFIERNIVYLVLFALGIGAFVLIRPTVDRFAEDYQLSASEQSELRSSLK